MSRFNYTAASARSRVAAERRDDRAERMSRAKTPLRARYASPCPACGSTIEPGSAIVRAFPTKRYKHAECPLAVTK